MDKKPLIFITNDDGDLAKGIAELIETARKFGDVVVMAPDGPRSGMSNALTVSQPIRFKMIKNEPGFTLYTCTGTPTDCVKIALNEVFTDKKPDLLLSGINHGSNAAINVIYSGTMGAVLEGCVNGINSIGLSIDDYSYDADFSNFQPYIEQIISNVIENPLPNGICLNVNSPKLEIKGIKITRQCEGRWTQEFAKRIDPAGRSYYWLTGHYENHEPKAEDTDDWAINHGYISIVPVKVDMTANEYIEKLRTQF